MVITVVPIYAAILAILLIVLSVRVIAVRRRERISLGDGNHPDLLRAISVHSNFCQYAPLTIILLTFNELQHAPLIWVNFLGILCVAGRILHAFALSKKKESFPLRKSAMILTFLTLIFSILTVFWTSI